MKKETTDDFLIFISHRHVDKNLADVLRVELESWGDDIRIFQSSSPEDGSAIGEDLNSNITEEIAGSCLVLSLCSQAPGDMDWCMFECGLALGGTAEEQSKVIPFSAGDKIPEPLNSRLSVKLTPDSIMQFVHEFHTEPEFIRGRPPYNPNLDERTKKHLAERLYNRMSHSAPEPVESVPVYDRITFGISFEGVHEAESIMNEANPDEMYAAAATVIYAKSQVLETSGDPQEHFGFDIVPEGLTLYDLIERRQRLNRADDNSWAVELGEAVMRALMNYPEGTVSKPFKSLSSGGGGWLIPVLARYRKLPLKSRYEFDVLFCRLATEAGERMLSSG